MPYVNALDTDQRSRSIDVDRIEGALALANIPALQMSLYQLTGDDRWLSDPYLPLRPRGMGDNDTAGYSEEKQAEVRAAAAEALRAYAMGAAIAIPRPDALTMRRMMAVCAAEPAVPDEYAEMLGEEFGMLDDDRARSVAADALVGFQVIIIGAGIGGLLLAHRLREAGVDALILEKQQDVGGTWNSHGYPGAGVDTPSYLYSFSFFHRDWSGYFSKQPEVLRYLQDFAEEHDLRRLIRFGVEVTAARYDETAQSWSVETTDGAGRSAVLSAPVVVSAAGLFGLANDPNLPGREEFPGDIFHSTRWPKDLDVTGKRVAIVGSGATAMQIVPVIADKVAHLTVFQKSAMWVAPAEQYFRPVPSEVHWLMNNVPFYREWMRFQLAWTWNDQIHPSIVRDPEWTGSERSMNKRNDRHREFFAQYILEQLDGRPDLIEKALPDYPPYGKRMLVDNGWYAALRRDNVDLVSERLVALDGSTAIGDGGTRRDFDVIALCTGYQTSRFLAPMTIIGRGGRDLRAEWGEDDARAFQGMAVPGFPNFFMLYGPNTNGSGGSYYSFAEAQVGYIVEWVRRIAEGEVGAVEPRQDSFDDYNNRMDAQLAEMVWAHPRVDSYYRNANGRITANRPWNVVTYWGMLRHTNDADYVLEKPKS